MSNELRKYMAGLKHFPDARDMSITATIQGKWGGGVQFTIGDNYIVMAQNQVEDLIKVLKARLQCKKGFSATDTADVEIIEAQKRID